MTKQRWGIVGLGTIGRLCHDIVEDGGFSDDVVVAAVADTALPLRSGLGEAITAFSDYRELLASEVDVVLVTTPPASHFEIARASLAAGKDVLIEKPPASTVGECEELMALGARSGQVLFFAFHARYNSAVDRAREELRGQEIRSIKATYQEDVLRFHQPDSWVHAEGVLRDSGINVLSVLTRILPDRTRIVPVSAVLGEVNGQGGEGRAALDLALDAMARARIELDWRREDHEERHITIVTGADEFTIDISRDRLYRNAELISGQDSNPDGLRREYERMLSHFQQCLARRTSSCSCTELAVIEAAHALAT